jgi:DNA-directed RNA polymerase subunit RPC12/RpoP
MDVILLILKCSECGNTFRAEHANEGEIVTCPICDANYQIKVKDGKIRLEENINDEKDLGELLD